MYFDVRNIKAQQTIGERQRTMRPGTRIDQNTIPSKRQLVEKYAFMVTLKKLQLDGFKTREGRQSAYLLTQDGFDIRQTLTTINLRLPYAKKIHIDAIGY